MGSISPTALRSYLVEALKTDNWNTLILRDSSDGIELELSRHHVWQLVKYLAAEAETPAMN